MERVILVRIDNKIKRGKYKGFKIKQEFFKLLFFNYNIKNISLNMLY